MATPQPQLDVVMSGCGLDVSNPYGAFQCEDVVEAFLSHAYRAASWKDVNEICQLKRVCKLFQVAIVRQLSADKTWLAPVSTEAHNYGLEIDELLARNAYVDFFDGMRCARINLAVQEKALIALDAHIKEPACMAVLNEKVPGNPPLRRCCVIAEVLHFHRNEIEIVKMGLGVVLKLLPKEAVSQKHYACISSAVIDAMYTFPADRTIQADTVDILHVICKQRPSPNAMLNHSPHDTVAHVLAGMRMFADDEEFQVRGIYVIKEAAASNWKRQLKPLHREDRGELVDAVWKETVENVMLQVMHTHKRSHKIAVDGCHALAQMAVNNLHELTKMRKLIASIVNWMQMFAAGRNLHASAMMPATALGVRNFSRNSGGVHVQNQQFFGEAGVVQLMLAGLNSYAKSLFPWPMRTATVVIQALDAVCLDNLINTKRFIDANGVGIMMRAAFSCALLHNEISSINFSDTTWMATFVMMKNILSHKERKRKNCGTNQVFCGETFDEATTTTSMPFLSLVCKKFSNTARTDMLSRKEYTLTELIVLCLITYIQCIQEKSKHQKPSDSIVHLCLTLLLLCMQTPMGMMEMRKIGITIVMRLKLVNAQKKISCFVIDVGCMEVLAMAASRTRMHDLRSGLFEIAKGTPWHLDGLCVKIPDKLKKTNEYVEGALRAQRAVATLRIALVRMQIKECMHLLLAAADDKADKAEIMKHTRIRVGSQEEVPREMTSAESQLVSSHFCNIHCCVVIF